MAKLSRDLSSGTLHPRENITGAGTLGALNSEILINADGASTVALDLRGTFHPPRHRLSHSDTVAALGEVVMTNAWTNRFLDAVSGEPSVVNMPRVRSRNGARGG